MQPVCKISITYWTYTAFVLLLSVSICKADLFFERGPGKLNEIDREGKVVTLSKLQLLFCCKTINFTSIFTSYRFVRMYEASFWCFSALFFFLTEQTTEKITTFAFQVALPWPYHIYTTCKCSNQLQQQRSFSNSIFFYLPKMFSFPFFYFILRRFFSCTILPWTFKWRSAADEFCLRCLPSFTHSSWMIHTEVCTDIL